MNHLVHPALYGLVAAGGFSRRMGRDKALICYHEVPQAEWTYQLLDQVCGSTFLSCRENQDLGEARRFPQIHDRMIDTGPLEALCAAHAQHVDAAWFLVACDLPNLTLETLNQLRFARDPNCIATAFISAQDGFPEPLCTIYEPSFFVNLSKPSAQAHRSPRKILMDYKDRVKLVELSDQRVLDNFNLPHEAKVLLNSNL